MVIKDVINGCFPLLVQVDFAFKMQQELKFAR